MLTIEDCVAGTRVRLPAAAILDGVVDDFGEIVEKNGSIFLNDYRPYRNNVWVKWDSDGIVLHVGYQRLEKI